MAIFIDRSYMPHIVIYSMLAFGWSNKATAGFQFEPYYSVTSKKSVSPVKNKSDTESETIKQREEKGLRAGISFYKIFKTSLAIGQSYLATTSKEQEIVDEYDQIDMNKELESSPRTPGKEAKTKEFQNKARFTLAIDPSFSIFILRGNFGVIANQRILEVFEDDRKLSRIEPPITYKPTAGLGFGIKFSQAMYALAEYNFYFYQFPKTEPFERELSVAYGFSI